MLIITSLYLGLLSLMYLGLSYKVAATRRKLGVGAGDGDDSKLLKAIRIHANFIEYVPIAIILMLVAELNHTSSILLHICGVLLIIARVNHTLGLSKTLGASTYRIVGVLLTWLIVGVLAINNIYYFWMSQLTGI